MENNIAYNMWISLGLPIVISLVTAYVTSRVNYNHEISKLVYEKKEKIYIRILEILLLVKDNPEKVFCYGEVLGHLEEMQAEVQLYACEEVKSVMKKFYGAVKKTYEEYEKLFLSEESVREEAFNLADGLSTVEEIDQEVLDYQSKHQIDVDSWEQTMVNSIRKELKIERTYTVCEKLGKWFGRKDKKENNYG